MEKGILRMDSTRNTLAPGSVVIFEGLDKAGKSTQLELLQSRLSSSHALFAHMPSGLTDFSRQMYSLLEESAPNSGLARQLAHLSCHSENIAQLVEATEMGRPIVLDRWWWSTMAYGWFSGEVPHTGLSEQSFRELINTIWAPITASIVFLFLAPRETDENNVDGVADGYRELAAQDASNVVEVPMLPPRQTHLFIVDKLSEALLILPN